MGIYTVPRITRRSCCICLFSGSDHTTPLRFETSTAIMPYNNTPIAPSKDVTGTVSLPLARVKKIIATDPDVSACSNNAAFVITVATEMFLQHLVEQSYNIVKSERKPRRNIQYRDVANAVARVENLEFLADVVPKTMTMKQFKQKQAKEDAARPASGTNGTSTNGQGTL